MKKVKSTFDNIDNIEKFMMSLINDKMNKLNDPTVVGFRRMRKISRLIDELNVYKSVLKKRFQQDHIDYIDLYRKPLSNFY